MIEMSEQINELAAALSKAQGEIEGAAMNSNNPAFKSKYANITEVWNACREPLSKYGLSVVQAPGSIESNKLIVTTMILHQSGQWLRSSGEYLIPRDNIQGIGSAITYARRYAMAAMLGITQDDDDGNEACQPTTKVEPRAQVKAEPKTKMEDIKQLSNMVRVLNGTKYQLMNKEGKWVNVDDLSLELLNQVRNFSGYEKAFNCIDACIAEKSM